MNCAPGAAGFQAWLSLPVALGKPPTISTPLLHAELEAAKQTRTFQNGTHWGQIRGAMADVLGTLERWQLGSG